MPSPESELTRSKMLRASCTRALLFGFGWGEEAFGDGEVADVFAELGVGAAEEGAVAGERVDEVEDVASVLHASFADVDSGIKH